MDKAILVIDMPENCSQCPLRYDSYGLCEVCILKDDVIDIFYETNTKPDWCPLQPMPGHSHTGKSDYYQWGDWEDGWNACIDGLLPD